MRRQCARLGLTLLGVAAGCSAPERAPEEAARSAEDSVETRARAADEPAPAPDARHVSGPVGPAMDHGADWSIEPMAGWTIEPDLEAFHDTWTAHAVRSARKTPTEDTLVPYADATTYHGASWGLSKTPPVLYLFTDTGHAYRYPEGRHGMEPPGEPRAAADLDSLAAIGLDQLQAGEDVHITYDGNGLRMLGALRAAGACGACHEEDGDRLLGVYFYAFSEIPDD